MVEVEVDESACVIRVGDRHQIKSFSSSRQSQVDELSVEVVEDDFTTKTKLPSFLTLILSFCNSQLVIPRSSSAIITVLDPLATSGILSDMSSFFAAEKSALIAATSTASPRPGRSAVKKGHRDNCSDEDGEGDTATNGGHSSIGNPYLPRDGIHSSVDWISAEPNLESLVFHCVSPSRLILVWWPRKDRSPSPLLRQIIKEASFDDGVKAKEPTRDQYCVVVGESRRTAISDSVDS